MPATPSAASVSNDLNMERLLRKKDSPDPTAGPQGGFKGLGESRGAFA